MAGETFDIVFAGRIAQGAEPAQVRANVAKLFKTGPAKLEHMFSGQRVFIKKGVDETTARNYLAALRKAGALAEIVPAETVAAPEGTSRAPAGPPAPPVASSPLAAAAPAKPAGPPIAPDYTIAEPGVILVEARAVAPVSIDTAHLSLAEVGADLVERQIVAEPQYDLTGLALDPPGTLLVEPSEVPPARIDISALKLAD